MGAAPLAGRAMRGWVALLGAALGSTTAHALEAELSGGVGALVVSDQHELVVFPNRPTPIGTVGGGALRGTVYPVRLPWGIEAGLSWEGDLQTGAALVGGHRAFASVGVPVPGVGLAPVVSIGAGAGVLGASSEALGGDLDWSGAWGGGVAVPVIGQHGRVRLDLRHHLASSVGYEPGSAGHVGAHLGFGWVFGRKRWHDTRERVLDLVSGFEDHPTQEEFAELGDLGQKVLLALAQDGTLPPSRASRVVTSLAFYPDDTTQRFLERKATTADDDAPWMQRKALWALVGAYGDAALPLVQEVLAETDDVQVRVAISKALHELDTPAALDVMEALPGVQVSVVAPEPADADEDLGDVRVVIIHPDGRQTSHLGDVRFVDAALPEGGEWTIQARRGRCERGEATVATAAELAAVKLAVEPVHDATLAVEVTTPDGTPVPGAKLTVRTDERACAPADAPVLDGGSGAVPLGEGTFEVFLEVDGYGTTRHEVTVTGDEVVPLPVVMEPTKLTIEKGKITTTEIYFDSGAATLRGESLPALQEIATSVELLGVTRMLVEGHTDDRGAAERNLELSTQRAESVRAKLVELGVPASVVSAQGFGQTRPVADNGTAAGRAKNRRVDFVLLEDVSGDAAPDAPGSEPQDAPE